MPDNTGVVDLSALKKTGPSIDALPPEEQEALEKMAEEHNPEPEGEAVRTAFLVAVMDDGTTVAIPDLDFKLVRAHLPTTEEMYAAVKLIAKDIEVQETAVHTAQTMQQLAMAQMQQRQAQQMAANLNLKGGI